MKKTRVYFWFVFFVLFLSLEKTSIAQPLEDRDSLFVVTSTYDVEIDFHNIFWRLGAAIFGGVPDSLIYIDTTRVSGNNTKSFSMSLLANGKEQWVFISSDTSIRSYTKLPFDDATTLQPDAILFISNMRAFLSCQKCSPTIQGILHMNQSKVLGTIFQLGFLFIPEKEKVLIHGTDSKFFGATTVEVQRSIPYMSGNILVERENRFVMYPYISIHLYKRNIDLQLYLKNVQTKIIY